MRNLFRLLVAFGAATTILIFANGAGAAIFAAPKTGAGINKLPLKSSTYTVPGTRSGHHGTRRA